MKRANVEPEQAMIPVSRQCELLDLSCSSFYYDPSGETEVNLTLMRLIDEQFTKRPFYGVRKMTAWLRKLGHAVNRKRVSRLMRLMGLAAIYPKPRLSLNGSEHKVYPYLLKGLAIDAPDQAWSADITYIRLAHGFAYLVAIMDWHSRYVLSWEPSTTLDKSFCLETLRRALQKYRSRGSSIRTRVRSSRAWSLRGLWRAKESKSAWTAGAGFMTKFSSSVSGGR